MKKILLLFLSLLMLCTGCTKTQPTTTQTTISQSTNAQATVHFIDVGQADCILIESNGQFMLIDAGNTDDKDLILNYLSQNNVNHLNYLILTHPHEDHIGSASYVVDSIDVDCVLLSNDVATTNCYERLITSLENSDAEVIVPKINEQYQIGNGNFTILTDQDTDWGSENSNLYSIGIRIVFGETSFVMCGDAEAEVEKEILKNNSNIKSTVLKLSHHGSSTSSCDEFIQAINPEYAVIMCGVDNSYGHPHKETMVKLANYNIPHFRTDTQGTIIASTDGKTITWNTDVVISNTTQTTQNNTNSFILNTSSKKIHLPTCTSVEKMSADNKQETNESYDELISNGYEPCGNCMH